MKKKLKIGLVGNPNSGKSTIFNNLTGTRQHVGNYPGVTVEKKEGECVYKDYEMNIVDLPGIYSLSAYSEEERVTRDFILNERPDVIIDIVDSSNLERNLYLATQMLELGVPLILAFNMSDIAKKRGIEFDLTLLSTLIGAPILETVGSKKQGMNELLDSAIALTNQPKIESYKILNYGKDVEIAIKQIEMSIKAKEPSLLASYKSRWLSVKLLENDNQIAHIINNNDIKKLVNNNIESIHKITGDDPDVIIADSRYGFISGVCQESVQTSVESRHILSDKIDAILTNRLLGLPIFLGLMYLTFHLTFTLGGPPMDFIDSLFGTLGDFVSGLWAENSDSLLKSLIVDGIIGGVGGVVIFLPNIVLLFFGIAILEDTGYMARAAFIMDRLMHKIGLHGKSFIPMLIGFGCSIPAIMATRTLRSRKDRLTTMLVAPLMSCGAKLPIYALIIPAFFPEKWHSNMLFSIYLIGIILAIISAKLLKISVLKGESTPFVMELPPYRIPTIKGVAIHVWERSWLYLKKAGTIILGISILLWALTTFPRNDKIAEKYEKQLKTIEMQYKTKIKELTKSSGKEVIETIKTQFKEDKEIIEQALQSETIGASYAGQIGHLMEPLIKPLGFDWKIGTALIGSFAAKEVFVAQMGIVFSLGETDEESESLREKLKKHYSPLIGFCIMLFSLVSAPCMATIAVTKRESNSWGWAMFQLGGLTALAYILTLFVYQIGTILKIGLI